MSRADAREETKRMTPITPRSKELVLYPARWKMGLLALGSLVFVLTGVFLWVVGGAPSGAFLRGICIADWLFFGFCFLFATSRLISPRPSLVLDDRGLTDNASAVGAGLVRWEEITGVVMVEMGITRYLTVEVRDPEAVLARQPTLKRWVMTANQSLGTSPITIPGALPISLDELAELITARLAVDGRGH
jgi:hypothetical protein